MIRFISLFWVLLFVFSTSRALIRVLPGDPLETLIAESGTNLPREALRQELRLDEPFFPALIQDIRLALHGDLGKSLLTRQPIAPLLISRFLKTLKLTFMGFSLALIISMGLGLAAARNPGSGIDRFCSGYGAITAALPTPWMGPMLIILLAVQIPIFPVSHHLALPALNLAIGFSGLWSRLIRERVRETLILGAAPGARARGVPEWRVVLKYGFVPTSGALLAYLGTQVGWLLAGAFVTEVIFDWQGMGSLLIESVLRRDYPVVESTVFVGAAASLLGNVLGDGLQNLVDPRQRNTDD